MTLKRPIGSWFDHPGDLPEWLRTTLTCVTPLGLLCLIVGASLAVRYIDRIIGLHKPLAESVSWAIASPILLVGLGLMLWSVWRFLIARGTPVPFNPPPVLITTGPYRYTRHPMVTGFALLLLGCGIGLQSVALLFILFPLIVAALAWEIRCFEEPQLIRRFGDAYLEYKKNVPMLFPRLRR